MGGKNKNFPCCWVVWKIICEAPKHWGSKTVRVYSKNTRMNEKTIKVMFVHSTSNRRSSGPHWCRLEKRSSLLILFSLHVQAPTSFFTPTVLLIHSPKKKTLSTLMSHILVSSLFFLFLPLYYLQPLKEVVCLLTRLKNSAWTTTGPYYQSMTRSCSVNLSA